MWIRSARRDVAAQEKAYDMSAAAAGRSDSNGFCNAGTVTKVGDKVRALTPVTGTKIEAKSLTEL